MTKELVRTTQFKRDFRLAVRRHGTAIGAELESVVAALAGEQALAAAHHDHNLTGWVPPARECHIRPDVLLIYRSTSEKLELVRLGSHSDLS